MGGGGLRGEEPREASPAVGSEYISSPCRSGLSHDSGGDNPAAKDTLPVGGPASISGLDGDGCQTCKLDQLSTLLLIGPENTSDQWGDGLREGAPREASPAKGAGYISNQGRAKSRVRL